MISIVAGIVVGLFTHSWEWGLGVGVAVHCTGVAAGIIADRLDPLAKYRNLR